MLMNPSVPQTKGRRNEDRVCKRLKKQGWRIICQNKRFFGVEVDLLAERKGIYILVEVKSLNNEYHLEKLLSEKQKNRLKAVAEALSPQARGGLCLLLALVNQNGHIRFVEVE